MGMLQCSMIHTKFFEWLSGARRGEQRQTLLSFLALFFLLLSYYLIKPLRNSQFLKVFDPDWLPFFFLITPIPSLLVTKLFNYFYERLPRYHLLLYTYGLLIVCKVIFTWYLPIGGKTATVIFFFWGAVYFLLAVSLLWACINTIFRPSQGERTFGFIAVGATTGNIVGAEVSSQLASSTWKDYAPLVSAVAMGLAVLFILLASQKLSDEDPAPATSPSKQAPPSKFWDDLKALFELRYVRSIAVMVYALAVVGTVVDFQNQKQIAQALAAEQYGLIFKDMNHALNQQQQIQADTPNPVGQELLKTLQGQALEQQQLKIAAFLQQHPLAISQTELIKRFEQYQDQVEAHTRKLFSDVYKYQGILGVIFLLVVARLLFRFAGLAVATSVLPAFFIMIGILFMFPLELFWIEVLMVISGALNYSLNNATKELLYTITTDETKFKQKPLIEGPIMRLGDVSASLLTLGMGTLLVGFMGFRQSWSENVYWTVVVLIGMGWWWIIWGAGRTYDTLKQQKKSESPP